MCSVTPCDTDECCRPPEPHAMQVPPVGPSLSTSTRHSHTTSGPAPCLSPQPTPSNWEETLSPGPDTLVQASQGTHVGTHGLGTVPEQPQCGDQAAAHGEGDRSLGKCYSEAGPPEGLRFGEQAPRTGLHVTHNKCPLRASWLQAAKYQAQGDSQPCAHAGP